MPRNSNVDDGGCWNKWVTYPLACKMLKAEVMKAMLKKHYVITALFSFVGVFVIIQSVVFLDEEWYFRRVPRTRYEAWDRVQRQRRKHLKKACSQFPDDTPDDRNRVMQSLRMDEKHQLLYCPVPKIASSLWKNILLTLSGRLNATDPGQVQYSTDLAKTIPELKHIDRTEAEYRFQHYIKFMFARHPLERILSAFRNKFKQSSPDKEYFHRNYGVEIIRRYRKNPSERSLREGDNVHFHEFVKFILDTYKENGTYALDPHWRPVADVCQPCSIGYDVIGNFETIELDAKFIFQKSNADMEFPKSEKPSKTKNLLEKYYSNVSRSDLKGLYSLYEKDFAIFNYEKIL